MLIPRLRASRLSAACVCGVTVSDMCTRATLPMNGRPPFFFAPDFLPPFLFFAAPFIAPDRPERLACIAIALRGYRRRNR